MDLGLLLSTIAAGFALAVLSELPAWYFCYSQKSFKDLMKDVEKKKAKVDAEKKRLQSDPTAATKKRSQAKLKLFEDALKTKSQEAAQGALKGQLISTVLMTVASMYAMRYMKDIVVGQLPFKPFWPVNKLTQQGLSDPTSPYDCSGVCIFFIAMSVMRNVVSHINPIPKGPSVWEVYKQTQEATN